MAKIDNYPRPVRLTLIASALSSAQSPEETRRLIAEDLMPDTLAIGQVLNSIDLRSPAVRPPGLRGRVLERLPAAVAEVWLRRHEIGVVLSWGENFAYPVAALICLMRRPRPGHIAILMMPFGQASPSRVKRMIKRAALPFLVRHGIDRVNIPPPLQRRWAVERWKLAPERIVTAQWPVDTSFWAPTPGAGDMICAVGREMRDYPTLIQALRPLSVPCHIAAGTAVYYGGFGTEDPRAKSPGEQPLPANITIGPKSFVELRELYARSRFVVVPILPSVSDNGISAVIEAMAMGRPVISTATEGRADILEDGVNCMLVPPQDVPALRSAIEELWLDPEKCARLGAKARESVVEAHGLEQWLTRMSAAAGQVTQPAG
jgi:glycosyltransferase involved in cell wall biosynthesis